MVPLLLKFLLIFLITTTLQGTHARRSRIDLPISNAADAPASDNIATASGDDFHKVALPELLPVMLDAAEEPPASSSTAVTHGTTAAPSSDSDSIGAMSEIEDECDPDMIGFEIVTGYV